ncbi:hypothetical protein ES703_109897 [subsurface metagenome]
MVFNSHLRQRLASLIAFSSLKPNSTSLKFFFLALGGNFGILGLSAFSISSSVSSTGSTYNEGLLSLYSLARLLPVRYFSIDSAASFPAAMASTTVLGPVTRSPPAKIPSRLVKRVSSSTSIVSHFEIFRLSLSVRNEISGLSPIAGMSVSNSSVNSEPLIGTGLLLPLSSKSPNFMRMHSTPMTFPFSAKILIGVTKNWISIPSSIAWSISSSKAGISFLVLLYSTVTFLQFILLMATRAESMAAFPPPTIPTFSPSSAFFPKLTVLSRSSACITPFASSPGMFSFIDL